ncbi:MAG TPA: hypothetical protein VKB50_07775 [Vicinamibacterales bacterium]|nr:hypothetical protein [Vicinamibacterales bacterium]
MRETARAAFVAVNFFVLALPGLLGSTAIAFAIGTLVLILLNIAILTTWRRDPDVTTSDSASGTVRNTAPRTAVAAAAGLVALVLVFVAARSWLHQILIFPIDAQRADMLVVIEHGIRRVLEGQNPYATYHVPWEATLPYGPVLWMPYLTPYVIHADIRFAAIASALFIPTVCAVCATALAFDRRIAAAAGCVLMLCAIVFSPDLRGFISIAHTPSYWPLIAVYAWCVARERWLMAALFGGVLIVARTTMVAVAPVLLLAVWHRERRLMGKTTALLAASAVLPFVPFALADFRALEHALYGSYQHLMKEFVWTQTTWAHNSVGVTGLLLRAGWKSLVEPTQVVSMLAVYVAAFIRLRRGDRPLPWMAIALLVFSMTTLWPVHYIYLDVFLLLVCGVVAEYIFSRRWHRFAVSVPLCATVLAIAIAVDIPTSPIVDVRRSNRAFLYAGFSADERGDGSFAWVDGNRAEVLLPRRSRVDARIEIVCEPNLAEASAVQDMSVSLNDTVLGTGTLRGGLQAVTLAAPGRVWQYGVNRLGLSFPTGGSPADSDERRDSRKLSVACARVAVRTP